PGPEMHEDDYVGGPQHDHLEPIGARLGFQDQFLGGLVIAVAAPLPAREVLRDRAVRRPPPVIDPERAEVDQATHAAKPYRLRDITGAAEIDVEGLAERLLHPRADQPGRV